MVEIGTFCLKLLVLIEVASLHAEWSRQGRAKDGPRFVDSGTRRGSRSSSHKNRSKSHHKFRAESKVRHGPIFTDSGLAKQSKSYSDKVPLKSSISHSTLHRVPKKYNNNNNNNNCCRNGGECILGSFCVCPKEYYGQYCEVELKMANCGQVEHRGWMRAGCSLCFCYDTTLTCLPEIFAGCENPTINAHEKSLEIEIYPPNKEDIYDDVTSPETDSDEYDYYYENEAEADDQSSAPVGMCTTWVVVATVFINLRGFIL